MIASVLKLSRADCKALELKDAYSIHRIIYSLFPKQDNETRDFLFADKGGDWNYRQILILSQRKPEPPEIGEIESKEIAESFLGWDYYGFEVILNPTQRNGPSQKTTPIRGLDNLHKWFIQRRPHWVLKLNRKVCKVTHIGVKRFERNKEGKTFIQTHGSATFIGKLKVIDRHDFVKSFKQGIGRAKGFGFGLLQIVPIQK